MKPPEKKNGLLKTIRESVEKGNFILKAHQKQRERERGITRPEVLYVLKTGNINPTHGGFDSKLQREKYAVWGRTIDGRELEIIVAFSDEDRLEIITSYDLNEKF